MLDLVIQRRFCGETRCMVHFQEVWLAVAVEDNVKAQDLEAHKVLLICRLACPVVVRQLGLYRKYSLYNDIFDLSHDFLSVLIFFLKSGQNFMQRSLMAVIIIDVCWHDKVICTLVDCIVCQVNAHVA